MIPHEEAPARPVSGETPASSRLDRRSLFKSAAAAALLVPGATSSAAETIGPTPVAAGQPEMPTRRTTMTTGGFSQDRLARMKRVMDSHVERGDLPGFVWALHRHGETIVEAGGALEIGGQAQMRRDSIFRIASLTKPVTAAAAMILVEECRIRLDDPVDQWLPELADRKVLKSLESPLDDTVPASRAITLRDLLTMRLGLGAIMVWPSRYPIQKAMEERGVAPSWKIFDGTPDDYLKRLGELPLVHQPGEGWLYDSGTNVAGILIERITGQELSGFMQERIFGPLGMKDTGFFVAPGKIDRLATFYLRDPSSGKFDQVDPAKGGLYAKAPAFESGSGGLVSTVDDYLAFCRMMLGGGKLGSERVLSRPTVELMTMDHLTQRQKADNAIFFAGNTGWGLGVSVATQRDQIWQTPGRFGWTGGYGTTAYTDPEEGLVGVLMTQRMMDSPTAPRHFDDFWTGAYQAIDD